tara:strand:- start:4439 stop:4825 length:387 start_codon:yes stop_codon:yes gene_type:complete
MATYSDWTVVFDDKIIINQTKKNADGHSIGYIINDDAFWNDSKWSNIWAIQYKDDNLDYNDTVEHRDGTPHKTWNEANLGDFRSQFVDKWDVAHLAQIQADWDNDNVEGESEAEKIARLGARPTSYSS